MQKNTRYEVQNRYYNLRNQRSSSYPLSDFTNFQNISKIEKKNQKKSKFQKNSKFSKEITVASYSNESVSFK